jgi:uncharacterized protein DUF5666
MQSILLGVSFALLSVVWWPTPYALAEDTKVARGTIVDIAGGSLTVKVRERQMTFSVDSSTMVEARGAGTKARDAAAVGKAGPSLADVLRVGQGVAVTYHEMNGVLQASHVRAVASAPAGTGSISSEPESMLSNGTVQSVGAHSITIIGAGGGGASFTQTFTIDEHTRVFARGASTAAAANGGRAPFNELISNGDRVSVSYHKMGDLLHASDVRVTLKAMH